MKQIVQNLKIYPQITQIDADYKKGEKNIYPQITQINLIRSIMGLRIS